MNLKGNTIVITGGTSGIGLGMAERFLSLGNKVIICGRRSDRLVELARRHPGLVTKVCDIADERHRLDLFRWIKANYPDMNVLVNNAGVQFAGTVGSGLDFTRVRQEVETNAFSVIHLSDLLAPELAGKPAAAIVNVSSGLAFVPIAAMSVYCATKAFVHSLTMSMRYSLKAKEIEVIEVIPPSVDTELGKERRTDPEQTHGGMPLPEFLEALFQGFARGDAEIAVGMAVGLREKGEAMFDSMNGRRE
ncbi:MAG TPA: SDR family NAD(P)-dependent oxidoreductase [Rectinemataceae bacterium]|nr:SDR family NAD(P)-dependent oxidoreductase [Rectinemataceae bacterium]